MDENPYRAPGQMTNDEARMTNAVMDENPYEAPQ